MQIDEFLTIQMPIGDLAFGIKLWSNFQLLAEPLSTSSQNPHKIKVEFIFLHILANTQVLYLIPGLKNQVACEECRDKQP